ncbi:MAG: flagellar basal body P-ring protein FlgI, partial [Terracidiphilus sp.]
MTPENVQRILRPGEDLRTGSSSWVAVICAAILVLATRPAPAATGPELARVKDVATIEGIRDNQLVGYGLVVGLHGTGDSSQTVFPAQTLVSALEKMG